MPVELLLEIGTEEIPSGYLEKGLDEFGRLFAMRLAENRIQMEGPPQMLGTPRRLVLIGTGISERQENLIQEISGPPKRVAYDETGKPTKAAVGFAKRQGIPVDALKCVKTPKGEYVFVKREMTGGFTKDILSDVLPKVIADIPWPKSMRWGEVGFAFARPIQWVVALLNGEIVPFEVAGVRSGNTTRGHRFMAPSPREVSGVQDYLQTIKNSFVVVHQQEREQSVEKVVKEAADTVSGTPANDPDLVKTVANLVEYPSSVCGGFDSVFLQLPAPVLITAMKEHQKYFAVYDDEGRLMPNFVAVNNTVAKDASVVCKGHERVLRARLSDADFFFREDRKRTLADRLEDLKGVIYQADLGTSFAKVQRFATLSEHMAENLLPEKLKDVRTAAEMCKCDLITQMVTEFPTLQGVMGEVYARMEGYPDEICSAIREHYAPARAGDELPGSEIGAIIGCADRMDTIVGCFAVGLEPSGSSDPFALRRHALAVIRIVEHMGWDISLREFIEKSMSILEEEVAFHREEVFFSVMAFFRERYRQMMLRLGYESDLIEAVISVEFDRIHQLRARIDQLKRFVSESKEFNDLAFTFKRIINILKKQDVAFEVNPHFFKEKCESDLWEAYEPLKDEIHECLEKQKYYEAMRLLGRLRKPVDAFFEGAEILTKEDEALKANRLGILQHLAKVFLSVADLAKFSI